MTSTRQRLQALERRVSSLKHPLRIVVQEAGGRILAIYQIDQKNNVSIVQVADDATPTGNEATNDKPEN